jgi:hypothetical protein
MPWFINEARNEPIFVRLSTLHYYDCLKLIEIDTATASCALVNSQRDVRGAPLRSPGVEVVAQNPT